MIFPKYRHTPIFNPDQKRCPVCSRAVYSLSGIHPQCAIQQADEPRTIKLRADRKKAAKIEKPRQRAWNKKCPGCGMGG